MPEADQPGQIEASRRLFCFGLAASLLMANTGLGLGDAWARQLKARMNAGVPLLDHIEAIAEGLRLDIGKVDIASTPSGRTIVAGEMTTFTFRYVVGKTPIQAGGFIWFAMRHVFQTTPSQTSDATKAGYVKVEAPPGVAIDLVAWPTRKDGGDLFLKAFPWQHPIEISVREGHLNPGDTITLIYGDRTGGGPGVRMQPTQEPGFAFRVYVAASSNGMFLPLAEDLVFPIVGGAVEKLSLIAPSACMPGKPIRLLLRAEDRFGNEAMDYDDEITLRGDDGRELRRVSIGPAQRGVVTVEIEPFRKTGTIRIEASDSARTTRSNPVRMSDTSPAGSVYFGDIHGHSLFSDGRGTPEEFYRYARNIAGLDFCALTDHDFMLTDEFWTRIQAATESANEPGRFVTIHAYEWSGMTEVGGDHNVYFRGTATALFRCRSYYDYRNQQAYHGREQQVNHVEDLYSALLARFPEGQVMTIPHFGGRPANSAWHNPRIERMIEIFSDHRRSHEWAYEFLRRGYRIGILASSDNHTGRPGYGFLNNPFLANANFEIGTGLIAVQADELSREAVFDAIFQRRAYATSGDRILLDVQLGAARMGEEFSSATTPVLRIEVEGTAPVTSIEVWKDVARVQQISADAETVRLAWTDPSPPNVGTTAAYWVRIVQSNQEEAISSPIWWLRIE